MTILFIADAAAAMASSAGLMFLGVFCFGLACILFPFVVMSRLGKIVKSIDRLRQEQEEIAKTQIQELQRQNSLSRQLLRAYGHDPEV